MIQLIGGNTPLYIVIKSMKIKKPETLTSDRKQTLKHTWTRLRQSAVDSPRGLSIAQEVCRQTKTAIAI